MRIPYFEREIVNRYQSTKNLALMPTEFRRYSKLNHLSCFIKTVFPYSSLTNDTQFNPVLSRTDSETYAELRKLSVLENFMFLSRSSADFLLPSSRSELL